MKHARSVALCLVVILLGSMASTNTVMAQPEPEPSPSSEQTPSPEPSPSPEVTPSEEPAPTTESSPAPQSTQSSPEASPTEAPTPNTTPDSMPSEESASSAPSSSPSGDVGASPFVEPDAGSVSTSTSNTSNAASGVAGEDVIDNLPELGPDLGGNKIPPYTVLAWNPYSPDGINVYFHGDVGTDGTIVDMLAIRMRLQVFENGQWTSLYSWSNCPECVSECPLSRDCQYQGHKTCGGLGLYAKGWYLLRSRAKGMVREDSDYDHKFDNSTGQWVKCAGVLPPLTSTSTKTDALAGG